MPKFIPIGLFVLAVWGAQFPAAADLILGRPPIAPKEVYNLPGFGPHPKLTQGGFSVDTSSREQVREFYNTVYLSSTGGPINSTAVTASCVPGTNSPDFVNATLRRINWFRAMAGLPATITFDATESAQDQQAALLMSRNGRLQHVGDWTGWICVSSDATNASGNSNLALGDNGPDAITGYILDNGANNTEVGHRRWILYPQTEIMGTGDVPAEGSYAPANATWVFDGNYGGPRPATRTPYVAWPPAGYVPYAVVFPQWSFGLSNADLSAATVTMASNGVPVPVALEPYQTGYGENTLVWYPTSLDPANGTTYPFGGTDTVYSVTVNNVLTSAGAQSFAYTVRLFDPAVPGTDYIPLVITGPTNPAINAANLYSCTPSANPATTGYQWLTAQATNGYVLDNTTGLVNFSVSPAPIYPVVTNPPTGTGKCFHLCHTNPASEYLQLNELLFPSNATSVSFKSLLGYATTNEIARVQVSTDGGGTWKDLYTQPGTGGSGETTFTTHTLWLTNASYVGHQTLLRFNYDLSYGNYYPQADVVVGWSLETIVITNTQRLFNQATNATASTNFVFSPTHTNGYVMQARAVIFNDFPTDLGTARILSAVIGPPVITLTSLGIAANQVTVKFTLNSGAASGFHLLQADQLTGPWSTNTMAVLKTNTPGSAFQFTAASTVSTRFYKVASP